MSKTKTNKTLTQLSEVLDRLERDGVVAENEYHDLNSTTRQRRKAGTQFRALKRAYTKAEEAWSTLADIYE